jgi:hypothetical protein
VSLRFTVLENEAKSRIMSNLKNLRTASEEIKSLVVHHDLTPCQRDATKQMLVEAQKMSNEQHVYMVRSAPGPHWDPKIVKFKRTEKANCCEMPLGQAASHPASDTNTRPAHNQNRNNNSNMKSVTMPAGSRKKKCLYLNADCLLNKRDELHLLMDLYKPDLVCISEYLPKNFTNHSAPHRGILIYTSKHLQATVANHAVNSFFEEQCWIQTALNSRDKLLVGGIYRSPNSIKPDKQCFSLVQLCLKSDDRSRKIDRLLPHPCMW